MIENLADLVGRQARVEGHENGASERHAEVRDELLRNVRAQVGDAVARLDAGGDQCVRQPSALGRHRGIGDSAPAMHDRDAVWVNGG